MLKCCSEFLIKSCCTIICPCCAPLCAVLPFDRYSIWAIFDILISATKIFLMVYWNFLQEVMLGTAEKYVPGAGWFGIHQDESVKTFLHVFKIWYISIAIFDILLIVGKSCTCSDVGRFEIPGRGWNDLECGGPNLLS